MKNLKENDIYKVNEITDAYRDSVFDPMHCFEGIFVIKQIEGGMIFFDTFWGIGDTSGKCFNLTDVRKYFKIKYCGNLDDYEKSQVHEPGKYYLKSDILRLSRQHACSPNCIYWYIKKNAKRNKNVMLKNIKRKMEDIKYNIEREKRSLEQYKIKVKEINRGDLSIYI